MASEAAYIWVDPYLIWKAFRSDHEHFDPERFDMNADGSFLMRYEHVEDMFRTCEPNEIIEPIRYKNRIEFPMLKRHHIEVNLFIRLKIVQLIQTR